jgi:hypothetical protein
MSNAAIPLIDLHPLLSDTERGLQHVADQIDDIYDQTR